MLLAPLRSQVADAARALALTGLVRGTSGNVSALDVEKGLLAVTPSGAAYASMGAADIVVASLQGEVVEGDWEPTSELALHLAVYQARPDAGAIVHTHSPFATTFAALREPLPAVHYILAKAANEVAVAPYARYGTPELARSCVTTLGASNGVLLANHGVVALGSTLAKAMAVAEAIETTAEIAWRARAIGQPVVLDDDEMDGVREAFGAYGQATRRDAAPRSQR